MSRPAAATRPTTPAAAERAALKARVAAERAADRAVAAARKARDVADRALVELASARERHARARRAAR